MKIQKNKAEFAWTRHTAQYMIPTVFYQLMRTKRLHNSMVCLTWNILIKKSMITKELTANSFFHGLLQGSWGRKPQTWKAAKILNIQAFLFFFLLKIGWLQLLHERNKDNFLRATKYSFHLLCTEGCQKLSNKEKETKFSEVIFHKSKLHVLFPLWKCYTSSPTVASFCEELWNR